MKFECSKRMRGILRQLAGIAHERELRRLLTALDNSFARWRRGEIDTQDLAALVDDFAKGPGRRTLSQRYSTDSIVHMNVAQAIVRGLLTQQDVPADVHVVLENAIDFCRQGIANGTVCFEDED